MHTLYTTTRSLFPIRPPGGGEGVRLVRGVNLSLFLTNYCCSGPAQDKGSLLLRLPGPGGHCLFEGRYPKQNYRPPVLCYHSPLTLPLLFYSPLFLRHQRKAYCYYCYYRGLPSVDIIFSCPDTITLITVAKTLIIANPGCFPWTSQAHNYSPNRKCPSDSPPS